VRVLSATLDLEARILYRDALMLILDKPAGIAVHAGPRGGPNLEQGFRALRFGLPQDPALAHRLDRDTSGCLVLGRHRKALAKLGRLFSSGAVEKIYWAVVVGAPATDGGRIELALRKVTSKAGWRMVGDPAGQAAVTTWRVLGKGDGMTWLECKPETGRTHQIRVHCALALGCPVRGDPVYGDAKGQPLHLHARAVTVPLYPAKDPITATAPVPAHLIAALKACGFVGK
jgi:tRNA pseudouridine32 synthase/23S rRNA pseudouridine746 synthase/23S rRNA pseudouridine1911/1915/1917 synthase